MNRKKIIKLSPLIVLLLAAVCLLVTVLMTNTVLIKWHFVGLGFVAIATIAQIIYKKYGHWMTLLPLMSGTFSFAALTRSMATVYQHKNSVNGITIKYQKVRREKQVRSQQF